MLVVRLLPDASSYCRVNKARRGRCALKYKQLRFGGSEGGACSYGARVARCVVMVSLSSVRVLNGFTEGVVV